ncbi:MAG: sensor histidine kinase, partial [Geobacter sp.]|nr:sensor histidine kinase [Geobacter sp.]
RAEQADRLKSAFLATMSHELRTPLTSIIGFTGILRQGLGGPVNAEQTKQLSMVRDSANHLLSLISDILDISKIEAGQLTVATEPFSLAESVSKVVQSVRPLAEKKGLELTLNIAPDVEMISSDPRRAEQVLLNLLSNAIKFTDQGSVSVVCRREASVYRITVSDTGIGISEDGLEQLFKPFHQIDTGLSRKFEGTGLGLSICKRLVELMGGSIATSSSPGRGSCFSFTLPAERS